MLCFFFHYLVMNAAHSLSNAWQRRFYFVLSLFQNDFLLQCSCSTITQRIVCVFLCELVTFVQRIMCVLVYSFLSRSHWTISYYIFDSSRTIVYLTFIDKSFFNKSNTMRDPPFQWIFFRTLFFFLYIHFMVNVLSQWFYLYIYMYACCTCVCVW